MEPDPRLFQLDFGIVNFATAISLHRSESGGSNPAGPYKIDKQGK
jgi:hypothetical protein